MNYKLHIAWLFCLIPMLLSAQVNEKVEEAYLLYSKKEHHAAAEILDEVVASESGSNNEVAWHIRGFVYKDLYVEAQDSAEANRYRDEAVKSFKTSADLDVEGRITDQNHKALNYLAITFYLDASDIIDRHDPQTIDSAEETFFRYVDILRILEPDSVVQEKIVDFYLAMSTAHRKIYESDRENNENHWNRSNEYFLKVLEIDPESFRANYSLAVSHYNKGAYNLRKLAVQEDFQDIFAIQSMSMASIRTALPFMMKANEIDPERIEAVRGLKIIYFNMNKEEKSEEYNKIEKDLKAGDK